MTQSVADTAEWQGWADVTVGTDGIVHIVHDSEGLIWYIASAPDTFPPAAVTAFAATPGHSFVDLKWTNPPDPDYTATMIRVSTAGYPTKPTDGTLVTTRSAKPGSNDSFRHSGVINGRRHYYAAFARDGSGNYAAAATASAVPYVPPDFDRDTDVDQADFGHLQACFSGAAVPQTDPKCADALLDSDEDVDANDFGIFQGCMSGANVPADPGCAN